MTSITIQDLVNEASDVFSTEERFLKFVGLL